MKINNLSRFTAIILLLSLLLILQGIAQNREDIFAYLPGDDAVYNKAVDAVGMITDRSGAVASGFFVNENTFVTNYHVTEDLDVKSAVIEMKDGRTFTVKKIYKEYRSMDLAVILTGERCNKILMLEETNEPQTGDLVYSLGNPTDEDMNVDHFKLTKGTIKEIQNDDWFYDNDSKDMHNAYVIQHTAIIKPGNSGGPLLNSAGKLIGVNTFFYGDSLNYAVHVNELVKILNKHSVAYNEPDENSFTEKQKSEKSLKERVYDIYDIHEYYISNYYYVFFSMILLYYMFVSTGTIVILIYTHSKYRKKRYKRV